MNYLQLYPNCVPVKGASRSIIYDLQRCLYHFIPNSLYEVLQELKQKSIAELLTAYEEEDKVTLQEYLDFLVEEGYGFLSQSSVEELFPELNATFLHPSIITNAILDIDDASSHDYPLIFGQLDELGCKDLQIRSFSPQSLDKLKKIIHFLDDTCIRSVELILQHSPETTEANLRTLCRKLPKLVHITVSQAEEDKTVNAGVDKHTHILFSTQALTSSACCGNIHSSYFSINIPTYTEARTSNTCLNRKISVDARGEIKNCPSMTRSFGHVEETSLKQVVKEADFTKMWKINKDQIDTCMDCEFRYMCSDCRAYLEEPENLYAKPQKCNYNPYTATWETEVPANVNIQ